MKAMILEVPFQPLVLKEIEVPDCGPNQVLIKISACAVCRTDLHVVDGELPEPKLPLIPGHEIIGEVVGSGVNVKRFKTGDRVGVPWLGHTCGHCHFCSSGHENLCDEARFTGYQIDGGYAEYTVADQEFVFSFSGHMSSVDAAPLLCAGLIGYRSLKMTGDAGNIGIFGFGAAAHIVTQVANYEGRRIYAFTRQNDSEAQKFARDMGATWAGSITDIPPVSMDAAIIYAPAGELVPAALRLLVKGGTVVCAGIHMSDIPSFPYSILWGERMVRSVANLTRADGEEFLQLAPKIPVRTITETYPLEDANLALENLRTGKLKGAAVLEIGESTI